MRLKVPENKILKFCRNKGYGHLLEGKSTHRPELLCLSDAEIISAYNAELRGIANYYALANDVKAKLGHLFYIGTTSLVYTLANKHKKKATGIYAWLRQGTDLVYEYSHKGKPKQLTVFKLKDMITKTRKYDKLDIPPNIFRYQRKTELIERIHANQCDICGREDGYFEVHHIRKLSDMKGGKQRWQRLMIERNRKTLVLCIECHDLLHAGQLPDWRYLRSG